MRKLFIVGGTWEYTPFGLQQDIVNRINKTWEPVWIPYPASYGDRGPYLESVKIGKDNLRNAINSTRQEYSIVGYSQGAQIAGDIALEKLSDPKFLRSYHIADPSRSRKDRLIGPLVPGHGVSGERTIGWKANQFAAPGDFICTNDNKFISNVARYTYNMSFSDPIRWVASFSEAARLRENGGDPVAAFRTISSYLTSQVHTRYATYPVTPKYTATQWIANDLNRWN